MHKLIEAEVVCGSPEVCLKYYIFGDRKIGYGIEIAKFSEKKADERVTVAGITRSIFEMKQLAFRIAKGQVFPSSLSEIVDDYFYARYWDLKSSITNNSA